MMRSTSAVFQSLAVLRLHRKRLEDRRESLGNSPLDRKILDRKMNYWILICSHFPVLNLPVIEFSCRHEWEVAETLGEFRYPQI